MPGPSEQTFILLLKGEGKKFSFLFFSKTEFKKEETLTSPQTVLQPKGFRFEKEHLK